MKKIYLSLLMFLVPFMVFAEPTVTDDEMLTLLKAIGAFILFLLLPGVVIGLVCSGIRTIRGWFNF